jgi:cytochrome c-type biogenesis protein CcmH/NrfG
MNDETNKEILRELRRLRRNSQWALYLSVAMVVVLGGLVAWKEHQLQARSRFAREVTQLQQEDRARRAAGSHTAPDVSQPRPYDEVSDAMDRLDYPKAAHLLRAIIARQPHDYYGYSQLGNAYLAMGDVTNAGTQYLRAYELFPTEANYRNLTAIRKRIAGDSGSQTLSK